MDDQQWVLVLINVLGGTAVLGSYYHGLKAHDDQGGVWGGVPQELKPFYTVSMLSAAIGYFLFSYFILFEIETDSVEIAHRYGFESFSVLYALILFPSAAWMPLTFAMLETPSKHLWITIRVVLAIVGLASLALLAALVLVDPQEPALWYWLAVAGSIAFCIQTALLDALIWPAFFPRAR